MVQLYRAVCLWAPLFSLLLSPVSASQSRRKPNKEHELPAIYPTPQEISFTDNSGVSLRGSVTVVTGNASDPGTLDAIRDIVSSAGGKVSVTSHATNGYGTQILVGTAAENAAAEAAAKAITGKSAIGLEPDGYVVGSGMYKGRPTAVLSGVDTRGTFYAAQTLRQLVDTHSGIPGVKVRDWPLMSIRGSIEGFYGIPWSQTARLAQYVFYGRHKMNTYIYTPKDDPLLRADWQDLYNASQLAQLKQLVNGANKNHVDFTFALSPGLTVCYSSDADFNTTMAKFDQVRNIGVHSFYVALDDIPMEFHCEEDQKKWPNTTASLSDYRWLAAAQAYYLSRIQTEYIEPHGLAPLQTVPTFYSGSQPSPYKKEFGTQLNKNVSVQWTGEGVFSPSITVGQVSQADSSYVTERLFMWDNFPVNDGMPNRVFLNPLVGRAADLYKVLLGFTSNPMIEPYASMPALAGYGDYTWNGPAYKANASFAAVLWELAGMNPKVHDALTAFVDINQNWPYRAPEVYAPELSKDIAAFWAAYHAHGLSSSKHTNRGPTKTLKQRLDILTEAPNLLSHMAMEGFASDVAPWSTCAMQWATACQHLIAMLEAVEYGDKRTAKREFNAAQEWVKKTNATTVSSLNSNNQVVPNSITPITGDGVFGWFLGNATAVYKKQGF